MHRLRAGRRGRLWIVQDIGFLLNKAEKTGRVRVSLCLFYHKMPRWQATALFLSTRSGCPLARPAPQLNNTPQGCRVAHRGAQRRFSFQETLHLPEGNIVSPGRKSRVSWKEKSSLLEGEVMSPGRKCQVSWKEMPCPPEGKNAGARQQKARRAMGITRRAM